jgi:uncharacterized protein (TIGR02145 family)
MKRILFILTIFWTLRTYSQPYLITFAATGESNIVESVKVENLTKGTLLFMNGSDVLRLTGVTGINPVKDFQSSELSIYPNPITDNATLEVFPKVAGDASINIYDITGKQVAGIQSHLENRRQAFRLSGIRNGLYFISVKGKNYQLTGKLVSNTESQGTIRIEKVNDNTQALEQKAERTDRKGTQITIDMAYTTGDRLKLTGVSGDYSTVMIDIPISDKTISFNFIACSDGDNISYPVVEIGSQVWMAENLKTTKYNNGDLIGTTTPATLDVSGESTPKYQWAYIGDESNVTTYGRLYTWHAATDSRNVCPSSWHVPADDEWTYLTDYLTTNGYGYGGSENLIAKSMASASGWTTDPTAGNAGNEQAGNNSSGFTALPGGYRTYNGGFGVIDLYAYWWSSTESSSGYAFNRGMGYDNSVVSMVTIGEQYGFSVRCLKDSDIEGMIKVGDIYVDKYEEPNVEGGLPFVMFSFLESENWCNARGKRLLYDNEWELIAGGPELKPYVYGDTYDPQICNTNKTWKTYDQSLINAWPASASSVNISTFPELLEFARSVSDPASQSANHIESIYQADPSGTNSGCYSIYNVFDLNGNVQEWTRRKDAIDQDFQGNIKGGYWSESKTIQNNIIAHGNSYRFYNVGFRCAKNAGK